MKTRRRSCRFISIAKGKGGAHKLTSREWSKLLNKLQPNMQNKNNAFYI
jgi:hypothetical protein